jgi:uncharacterized membrane protein (DUF485 family)
MLIFGNTIGANAGRLGKSKRLYSCVRGVIQGNFWGATMAGFERHAAPAAEAATERNSARATRYGRMLFVLYALLYGGFVLVNAFAPALMQTTPLGGINLAVLYGLGLILAAFVLAVFYDWLCRLIANSPKQSEEAGQ